MLKQENKKQGSFRALIGIVVLLALIVVLENIAAWIPGMPAVLQPTSQLFTVLKKGAVYSLVAVSMNLLNGFTGLFSLGQAGFMLLGAYTFAQAWKALSSSTPSAAPARLATALTPTRKNTAI